MKIKVSKAQPNQQILEACLTILRQLGYDIQLEEPVNSKIFFPRWLRTAVSSIDTKLEVFGLRFIKNGVWRAYSPGDVRV